MKKERINIFMGALLCVMIMSCCTHSDNGNESSCVVIEMPDSDAIVFECVEADASGMKIRLENISGKDIAYGKSFTLECLKKGEWEPVKKLENSKNITVTDEGLILKASNELILDWESVYGSLSEGKYRLILSSLFYMSESAEIAIESPVIEFMIQ